MRRDTLIVKPMSNFVIRFRADNPGIWLFHCHIEWHMDSGLAATMIEAPSVLQEQTVIPQDFMDLCAAGGTATVGNAAGNTDDYLDLSGQNRMVPWLPSGFTTKGYVALVFSCISGFLGVATIAW
jgi:iron transport multicopper oxidase